MERRRLRPIDIRSATKEETPIALQYALRAVPTESRPQQLEAAAEDLRSGKISAGSLLVACRKDSIVGGVFAQVQPGRSAVLWPPGVESHEAADTARRLLAACLDWLASQSVRIAQVVLERVSAEEAELLESQGFRFLADLLYLGCLEREFPTSPPAGPLDFEPYSDANHSRLARIVEATYQQTLDCPGLDNVRDVEDVLAGYRGSSTFHPSHWLIVRHAGQDVGSLLLADYPQAGNLELVYMGLMPAVRGHGWGRHIVRHAQWLARQAGRPRVVLAVDASNKPAIRMYADCGFETWDRRRVYLKVFQPRGE